jgi:predicted lipid-binding transport protein (Tim44 family)
MSSSLIQLLVLAGVAVFLILKLRSVLGTREGFEKPPLPLDAPTPARGKRGFEVIEGGPDRDITDHAAEGSASALALAEMKRAEPSFSVGTFLQGARGAYEMILMGFERNDLAKIKPFLAEDVAKTFADALAARDAEGLTVDANFVGIRDLTLQEATFHNETKMAEIAVRFTGELTSVVRNKAGEVIEGKADEIKRQRDVWTFARTMGSNDPNWLLVATGD